MNDAFATIYETWFQIWNIDYNLIFQTLFDDGGYNMFGLSFILIPLVLWILFYFVWKYPYGKFIHWLLWVLVTGLIVSGTTFGYRLVA